MFSGSATVDGQPAPQGTLVSALLNDTVIAPVVVNASGQYEDLRVPTPNVVVSFTIGGIPAAETVTSAGGGTTTLALSATRSSQQRSAPPTNTPGPTPASIQSAFRSGPTVRLRPVDDIINQDQDGIVEIIFRNPALNETAMVVDLTVSLASGLHVYGEGFATDSAAGTASGTYTVRPGQSTTVYLNVKAEKTGRLPLQFSGAYWPEGNKDLYNPITLSHSFVVNQASQDPLSPSLTNSGQAQGAGGQQSGSSAPPASSGSGSSDDGDPSASCSLSPSRNSANGAGDAALLVIPLVGLAGMVLVRNRRRP